MDLKFLVNEEKSESFLTFVPKFSFVNKYTDIDDFNKYEKIEDLFKIDNNQVSFEYTFSNLKELKQNVHPNPINEDENKFDKKFAENIQWKETEKILSKRPFKEKKIQAGKRKNIKDWDCIINFLMIISLGKSKILYLNVLWNLSIKK